MHMISASKEKMRRMAMASYKENQNFVSGTPVARYNDARMLVGDERQKRIEKGKVVGNWRSNNL